MPPSSDGFRAIVAACAALTAVGSAPSVASAWPTIVPHVASDGHKAGSLLHVQASQDDLSDIRESLRLMREQMQETRQAVQEAREAAERAAEAAERAAAAAEASAAAARQAAEGR